MRTALIGHTGFVGGNLLVQMPFSHCFNSKSIESIRGECFDLLVCAGAPAEKWKANRDPESDRAAIERLIEPLSTVRADRAILISTVDVFGSPIGFDEGSPVDPAAATPYGRHRYELEQFFGSRFGGLIVRLPGLFGPGLKKNVIFDLLHGNQVSSLVPESEFQFYDLSDLSADIRIAERAGIRLLHCATEPVSVADVAASGFDRRLPASPPGIVPARYDLRSRHASLFGGATGYLRDRSQVLIALSRFVKGEQARLRKCA